MLTEQQVHETPKRRLRVMIPVLALTLFALWLYLAFLGGGRIPETLVSFVADRFGDGVGNLFAAALILPCFAIFLVPMVIAERHAKRFKTVCPFCNEDVAAKSHQLLATRCCPVCEKRILVDGKARSAAVYERAREIQSLWFLRYWLWVWPVIGASVLGWWAFDRSVCVRCSHHLWLSAMIGTTASGWTWLRTRDRRYLPQLLVSIVLLGLGVMAYW